MAFTKFNKIFGKVFIVLTIAISTILIVHCKEDDPKEKLIGSWERSYEATDTTFDVSITFKTDGTFTWETLEEVPNHTNSSGTYVATDVEIKINSNDCSNTGIYSYIFVDGKLIIGLIEDECELRVPAIAGLWKAY